ncbi:hypothetical protein AAFF_G00331820 [Aldrovandia affinis]|uniref:Uncharacterized protein n=1 Tax=Aldrovandia affinis TaxID=143900 RepID=A0AAD7SLE3_9TELE|nr:hypothetical protein AAFF_G00331820 [Aldrovandia affinis]
MLQEQKARETFLFRKLPKMFQLGSRLVQFQLTADPSEYGTQDDNIQQLSNSFNGLLEKIRNIGGLKKEDIFATCEYLISIRLLRRKSTSSSSQDVVFSASIHQDQNDQLVEPCDAQRGIRAPDALPPQSALPLSRLPAGRGTEEEQGAGVPCVDLEAFLHSFREGYVAWVSDALTPSWLSGHLSYRQLGDVKEMLRKIGTWDLVRLHCGEQLKGDYLGCQHIALNRQETDKLEFSKISALSAGSLWALLGHSQQVTVKMYKRGGQAWLGKPLSGTATIPSKAHVVFRVRGEDADCRIPATRIHSISLSI